MALSWKWNVFFLFVGGFKWEMEIVSSENKFIWQLQKLSPWFTPRFDLFISLRPTFPIIKAIPLRWVVNRVTNWIEFRLCARARAEINSETVLKVPNVQTILNVKRWLQFHGMYCVSFAPKNNTILFHWLSFITLKSQRSSVYHVYNALKLRFTFYEFMLACSVLLQQLDLVYWLNEAFFARQF